MISKSDSAAMPRVVHDYRVLNENTIKDHTPLSRQDQIIRHIAKANYRGHLDCPNSYYQINMCMTDVHKTVFKTPFGMFEWLVMLQRLCNASDTFQRFMNWVLQKYIGKICYVYFDDIVIFSDTLEEHKRNVRLILEALREAGSIVFKKKFNLFADRINFFEHIISFKSIEVGSFKVEKIVN